MTAGELEADRARGSEAGVASLSADHPLKDPANDRLGYREFARTLAHSVLRGSPAEGMVVAIYGEWGLGKTTLLNFIEHFVCADPDADDPIVVRFNPWWFSGRDDLLGRFFLEFEAAVAKSRKPSALELARRLKPLARAIGKIPGFAVDAVVPGLGRYTEKIGAFLGAEPSLPAIDIKRALSAEMAKNLLRIFVFIDDIDRLPPGEMVDVFRLVRAIADLPNVTYLLAMDRAVVTSALTERYGRFGDGYLDKIVQVSFDLPVPKDALLTKIFLSQLNALLSNAPAELVDMRRWRAVYDGGIRTFLKTPRDVVRFVNALALTFPGVRDEVNPIDFVAIEALRMFHPAVYRGIQERADEFVGIGAILLTSDDPQRARLREFHESWLPQGEERGAVRQVVAALFPVVARAFAQSGGDNWNERAWRVSRRVCSEEHFQMYFHYSLGDEALPRLEVARILALEGQAQLAELERLARARPADGPNRFRQVVEGIADRAAVSNGSGIQRIETLLRNLFTVGELVAEPGAEYLFSEGDDKVLAVTIEALLRTLPEPARVTALRDGLQLAGVAFATRIAMEVAVEHGRHGGEGAAEEKRLVNDLHVVTEMEGIAVAKITAASADGTLWSSGRLRQVLAAWGKLTSIDEVRAAVEQRIADDRHLMAALAMIVPPARGSRDGRMRVAVLEELFDLESVARRAASLCEGSGWAAAEVDAARYVVKAWEAKSAGRLGPFGEV